MNPHERSTQPATPAAPAAKRPKPVVLCILDGWGERASAPDNAIALASIPNWRRFVRDYPHSLIDASELHVGLPKGQMGNSEVGHMNLGAGRVVMQDLPRIDAAIADGSIGGLPEFKSFVRRMRESGGTVHLLGLLSPGGVHSHQDHMAALARLLNAENIKVAVHGFLDGRDTPPKSAEEFVTDFQRAIAGLKNVTLASLGGRYFGMDRDKRWDRLELAYDSLFGQAPHRAATPAAAIDLAYARGETDEFVKPTLIGDFSGIRDGDGLLMANFRADRVRQLLGALLDPDFAGFKRKRVAKFAISLGLVEYSADLARLMPCLFPPIEIKETLGEIAAKAGLTQLRIAETEKYAHVTFFFNGGEEALFPGEERILVESPKVATYDLKPEMAAIEVTDKLVAAIAADRFDLVVVNYANGDMVGHTGDLAAARKAVETIDACLGRLAAAAADKGGVLVITADHGNAEMMLDPETGTPHTAHTLNRVPFVLIGGKGSVGGLDDGCLADVAPTILELMNLPQPAVMTGRSLIRHHDEFGQRLASRDIRRDGSPRTSA